MLPTGSHGHGGDASGEPRTRALRLAGHLELSVGWVSPRVAVDQWLNSPGHRENLFRPQWRTVGIGILRGADFDRFDHGVIWVNQFGDG